MKQRLKSMAEHMPLESAIWFPDLTQAVARRDSPWRTPSLATVAQDGVPDVRTVVLRGVYVQDQQVMLEVHSHVQTHKVDQINSSSHVSFCFWNPETQCQLRASGHAQVHHNDQVAAKVWQNLPQPTTQIYAVSGQPGQPVVSELGGSLVDQRAFCVIRCDIHACDFLSLACRTHHREKAKFDPKARTWVFEKVYP